MLHQQPLSTEEPPAGVRTSQRSKTKAPPAAATSGPSTKKPKTKHLQHVYSILPSTMSVREKHIILLAMLLVHESDHLINKALSSVLDEEGRSPEKMFSPAEGAFFSDCGHLMERHLYGYVIHHGYDDHVPHPFGVHEILGALKEERSKVFILQASEEFLQLVRNPTAKGDITAVDLRMFCTSPVPFVQKAKVPLASRSSVLFPDLPFREGQEESEGSSEPETTSYRPTGPFFDGIE